MGLFSNKKKLCPLCGGPTPRLLATKVEDMPLCKDCGSIWPFMTRTSGRG